MNIRPVFLDEAYATNTEWKQKLDRQHIDSCATNRNERPNCGRQCRRQPRVGQSQGETHPVFVGDTIYAESTVLSKRESVSQLTAGYRYRFYSRVESGRQGSDELRTQHADLQTEALTRSCRRKLTSCVRNLNQKLFSASPPDINRRRGICP